MVVKTPETQKIGSSLSDAAGSASATSNAPPCDQINSISDPQQLDIEIGSNNNMKLQGDIQTKINTKHLGTEDGNEPLVDGCVIKKNINNNNIISSNNNHQVVDKVGQNGVIGTELALVPGKEDGQQSGPAGSSEDEDGTTEDEDDEEDAEVEQQRGPEVPEGGWGWIVVFAAFVVYWLVPGMIRSYGAIYLEVLETFPESTAAEAGWIPALLSSISIGLAPISAVLGKLYTCRNVVFVGGLFCSIGLSLSFFATSIFYLYVTLGLITGIGAGLCTTPSVIVINSYFVKKRAMASGFCLSGAAVGSFTIPIFVKHIVAIYKLRGTLLIMGGIILHVCAMSLLFTKDGKWITAPKKAKKAVANSDKEAVKSDEAEKPLVPNGVVKPIELKPPQLPDHLRVSNPIIPRANSFVRSGSFARSNSFVKGDIIDRIRTESMLSERSSLGSKKGLNMLGRDRWTPPPNFRGSQHVVTFASSEQNIKRCSSISHSMNDMSTTSVIYEGNANSSEESSSENITVDSKKGPKQSKAKKVCRQIASFFEMCLDFSLFKELAYVVTVFTGLGIAGAFPHVLIFVPAFAQQMGTSKTDAGMLLSICSAVDIVGRISYGWFMDLHIIKRSHGLAISCSVCAIGTLCIPLSTNYGLLAFFTALYGFGSGTGFMLLPVILADNHGVDRLPSTYGLMRLFQGFVMLIIPPVAGFLKDTTGLYEYCFLLMGSLLAGAAISMLFMPCAERRDMRKGFIPQTEL